MAASASCFLSVAPTVGLTSTKQVRLAVALPRVAFSSSSTFGHRLVKETSQEQVSPATRRGMATASASATAQSFHDFTVEDIDGKNVSLSNFKGKVALVVNVASACGLTQSNYTELTAVYNKYKDKGFTVLAFPSNQFGGQEPGSNEQIKEFACSRYKATFPLFSKIDVNGPNTAPVYQYLKSQKGGGILGDGIKWNFGKFLVDKDGTVVGRYAPTTSPSAIEKDIEKLL
eukprot:TRINITY_DN32829_c0_g1_i1.p1 TRINITY_DN32829_c0_g1~~TRINITY_DN32829_c0_g1_i1.p1  ORF type:complete len:230 (+),score=42.94 TRINITY_DN32829_c0_g1_i1:197-886(+)